MLMRLILLGVVAGLGWEIPSQTEFESCLRDGYEQLAGLAPKAEKMPDGVDAFFADAKDKELQTKPALTSGSDHPAAVEGCCYFGEGVLGIASVDEVETDASQPVVELCGTPVESDQVVDAVLERALESMAREFSEAAGQAVCLERDAEGIVEDSGATEFHATTTIIVLDSSELDEAERSEFVEYLDSTPMARSELIAEAQTSVPEPSSAAKAELEDLERKVAKAELEGPWSTASTETVATVPNAIQAAEAVQEEQTLSTSPNSSTSRFATALKLTSQALEAWAGLLNSDDANASASLVR